MILISRIKQIIDGLLAYVENDFNTVPETETLLYHMFYGQRDGKFDFYEQAKEIFLRKPSSPRKVTSRIEYPKDKSHMPCIIIREPSKNPGEVNPLGGFGAYVPDQFGGKDYRREGFVNAYSSRIELMCFSDNMLESVLMGEVIYTLLIGARNTLEDEFVKFSFSTSEIIAQNEVFPMPILIKNIVLEIEDVERYASIIRPELIHRFIIERPIIYDTDPDWEPPVVPEEKYFEFAFPYVWLGAEKESERTAMQYVYSNTDWVLFMDENELFKFGKSQVWLDDNDFGRQEIEAKVPWKLE